MGRSGFRGLKFNKVGLTLLVNGIMELIIDTEPPLSAISTLHEELLLEVFDFYRYADEDDWATRWGWLPLTHVCRRWRNAVLASPRHLGLALRCTAGTPVLEVLNHFPSLPLSVDYSVSGDSVWAPSDEQKQNLSVVLDHMSRVRDIWLCMPGPSFQELIARMEGPAPALERLDLIPETADHLYISPSFLGGFAPNLHSLYLVGVSLPTPCPLLCSTISLTSLALERIPCPEDLTPDVLVRHLSSTPHLLSLSIGFLSTGRRFEPEYRTSLPRVALPKLLTLFYHGVSAYLEAFVPRIDAPQVKCLRITLFNQLTFSIPRLSRFVTSGVHYRRIPARVDFAKGSASIRVSSPSYLGADLYCGFSCRRFDFQVSSVSQICGALEHTLSTVDELSLEFYKTTLPEKWRDLVDPGLWHALLMPFRNLQTLWVSSALAAEVARSLQLRPSGFDATSTPKLVPTLRQIKLVHRDVRRISNDDALAFASDALRPFLAQRQLSGDFVELSMETPSF